MLPEGIRRFFRLERGGRSAEDDVELELEHHFAAAIEDLVRRGIPAEEARRIAERRFGDIRATREALIAFSRARAERRWRIEWRSDWWMDVRQAIRGYGSTPGVTAAVIVMLALGVGANAAMYGILDKLFVQPPPHITAPESILRLYVKERSGFTGGEEITHGQFDVEQFTALARDVPAFAALAGYWPGQDNVGRGQAAEQVSDEIVTGNYFDFLGVRPERGRFIEPADDNSAAAPGAVISHGYWQRRYGASDSAVGTPLTLDRVTYTIVGVAPRGFSGPTADAPDVWIPVQVVGPSLGPYWRQRFRGGLPLRALARLRPGLAPAVAAEQAAAVLRANYETAVLPVGNRGPPLGGLHVFTGPLMNEWGPMGLSDGMRLPLLVEGVAAILLVIACANVMNLLLLRAVTRRRELAVRSALGAGRWRVARMLLIESIGLALAAGTAAIVVATVAGRVFRAVLLPGYQWATGAMDLRVLLFAGAVALLVGLITGTVPAIQARGRTGVDDLRAGVRAARRDGTPLRAGLLVLQGALALVLVVGAGVFYRSVEAARHYDVGYNRDHLLVVILGPADPTDRSPLPESAASAMAERARRLPGVAEVAQATSTSSGFLNLVPVRVQGMASLPRMRGPFVKGVTDNYFRAWGLSITRGRGFNEGDREGSPRVAVVDEAMARVLWPSANALGACLLVGRQPTECTTVVGVVEAEKPSVLSTETVAQFYLPLTQYRGDMNRRSLVVLTRGSPSRLVAPVLRAMGELFPDLPRERVRALPDLYGRELRPWKVGMGLFAAAASLALLLAAVGLYAMIAYTVRQRQHEFGIRRALGARAGDIGRLVMGQSVAYAALGMVVGAALAYWGARFVTPLLYQNISPRDPSTLITSGAVLLAACLAAGFLPARAAGRADPRAALQAE